MKKIFKLLIVALHFSQLPSLNTRDAEHGALGRLSEDLGPSLIPGLPGQAGLASSPPGLSFPTVEMISKGFSRCGHQCEFSDEAGALGEGPCLSGRYLCDSSPSAMVRAVNAVVLGSNSFPLIITCFIDD